MGIGGNLSPGMLLSAYSQGVFPWFNPRDPILWWTPDPRFVLFPAEVHLSSSMRRVLRKAEFRVTADTSFGEVIRACARTPRPGQRGTWITEDMELGYRRLHELGYAHSFEVWRDNTLAGGLYGVSLGRMFFGESMFSHEANASKVALITLARFVQRVDFALIDSQLHTPHVERMGGREIARADFLRILRTALASDTLKGPWTGAVAAYLAEQGLAGLV